jgi:hypothetical protein
MKPKKNNNHAARTTNRPLIPWASPDVRPKLIEQLASVSAKWWQAADFAPQIEEAPAVAEAIDALLLVLKQTPSEVDVESQREFGLPPRILGDADRRAGLKAMRTAARKVLDLATAARENVRARAGGGRPSDHATAGDDLAEKMDRLVNRHRRNQRLEEPSVEEMASSFLSFVAQSGPIAHDLKHANEIRVGMVAQHSDRATHMRVVVAFKALGWRTRERKGHRYVVAGLRALGPTGRRLGDTLAKLFEKRFERGRPSAQVN